MRNETTRHNSVLNFRIAAIRIYGAGVRENISGLRLAAAGIIALAATVVLGSTTGTAALTKVTASEQATDVAGPPGDSTGSSRVTAPWPGRIDTRYRGVVNNSYKTRYAPHTWVPSGHTGLGCLLGGMSSRSHQATLASVNYVRALSGLAPVSFSNSAMNRQALEAAVMMQANNRLSHDPLTSWLCYTAGGDAAAHKSNLALNYPSMGSGRAIDLYMDDPGGTNTAVGHRRWVLYPFTTVMGNGTTKNANVLTVVGPTSSARHNPRWVRWPTSGYFPRPLEPAGRWSLSSGYRGDNFSRSWVRMWKGSTRIYPRKYAVRNGYGMPTVVWQLPASVPRVGTFTVKVGNICRSGVGCFSTKYKVNIFNTF